MRLPDFWTRNAWRIIVFALIVLVAIISIQIAHAAGTSATLTWTHATSNTDGSTLALTEIKETLIVWRRPGNSTITGSVRVTAPATTIIVPGLVCGNFNFTGVTIVKTNDVQSAETAPVLYATGVQCLPNPPSGLGAS
jgi:hypothetical protein